MNETSQKYRDVCIKLATKMLNNVRETKNSLAADQAHYAEMGKKLKKVHDYAQKRYEEIQNNIFINGGHSYFTVLKRLKWSIDEAKNDTKEKYRVDIIRGEDGSMALALKKYGRIVFVRDRRCRAITGYGTIGSKPLYVSFVENIRTQLKGIGRIFHKTDHYEDSEDNLVKK